MEKSVVMRGRELLAVSKWQLAKTNNRGFTRMIADQHKRKKKKGGRVGQQKDCARLNAGEIWKERS
jgi:hypothetical protein